MSSHPVLPPPPAAAEHVPPQPPPISPPTRQRPAATPTSTAGADLIKDLGAVALFLLGLGSTFWVTQYSSRTLLEEWPLAALAGLTALGVVVSAILRRLVSSPFPAVHMIRLAPAGLLVTVALLYLFAVTLGLRAWTAPGFGTGYLLVFALGIVAALPRTGDPLTRKPSIWTWFGLSIVAALGIAHLLLPVYANAWNLSLNAIALIAPLLLLALVPAVSLWAPLQGLRPGLRVMGLTVLAVKALGAFAEGPAWFAGQHGAVFGLDDALLLAGLLSFGLPAGQQPGRRFARASAVLTVAVALLAILSQLALSRGDWEAVAPATLWGVAGGGLAAVVFLALQGSRRRALVLPALVVSLVLFALPLTQFFTLRAGTEIVSVCLAVVVLLLITLVRLDRDPEFDILPPALQDRYASDAVQLDAMEGRAHQQSAIVLATLSLVTGPVGILMGIFAFHRAQKAEAAGLLTTAIRMVAGLGSIIGIVSMLALPAWLAAAS